MTNRAAHGGDGPPPRPSLLTAVRRSLALLGARSRRRYFLVVGAQMATSLLDLAGVVLVGVTVVFAYSVPAGVEVPGSIATVIDRLGLQDVPESTLALACAATAAVLLLLKSAITALLLRRIFRFLSNRQSEMSSQLARRWFAGDVHRVHAMSDINVEHSLTVAVQQATTSLLGSAAVVLTELSLLVVLGVALILVDPVATILAAVCFAVVSVVVHRALSGWSRRVGGDISRTGMQARNQLRQSMDSFRELSTARRLGFPLERFEESVRAGSRAHADSMFINNVPKVAYEAALVVGAAVLVAWQVGTADVASALALLAVFLTAAARLLPSMVRLQGQLASMGASAAQAEYAFEIAERESDRPQEVTLDELGRAAPSPALGYPGFEADVTVDGVTVRYPGVDRPILDAVSLTVSPGDSLVLVGPTGAGKSTLVDVILGFTVPSTGVVRVGGLPVGEAQARWPGAVAYMPQHSQVWGTTVRDNVALGLPGGSIDDDAVWHALEQAHLADDVRVRGGLDYEVGPGGRFLSGGQRQRLGIARALYSQPRLLVLDEATSALDEDTEALIGGVLDELRGDVTVIAVAHRRATIERAGAVAVVEEGRLTYCGSPADYYAWRP